MTVATRDQPDVTSQNPSEYVAAIDATSAVDGQIGGQFAPHEAATPNMTVLVDAGNLMTDLVYVSKAQQTSATITAPTTNPRIDRIVIDRSDGTVSVIAGTEAASPTAPAITNGKLPVAQVLLQTTTTQITNSIITDERAGTHAGRTPVILDSPELLDNTLTAGSWQTVNSATLNNAGATSAIIRVRLAIQKAASTSISASLHLRKTGSGLAVTNQTNAAIAREQASAAATLAAFGLNDAPVNLDTNSDFDYYYTDAGSADAGSEITLIGYYA